MNTDRKILAVDNDENALYNLRQEIKDIYPSAKIAAFCEVTQVLTYLNEQEHRKLDYAFLDTCLCGLPGIELARVIREYNPKTKIIFCTEHSENALEAFSVHAAAYLLKPITEDKLRRELNELERMNEEIPEPPRLVVHHPQAPRRLSITEGSLKPLTYHPNQSNITLSKAIPIYLFSSYPHSRAVIRTA